MFAPDAENPEGVDSYCHKMNGEQKRKYLKDACYRPNSCRPQIPTGSLCNSFTICAAVQPLNSTTKPTSPEHCSKTSRIKVQFHKSLRWLSTLPSRSALKENWNSRDAWGWGDGQALPENQQKQTNKKYKNGVLWSNKQIIKRNKWVGKKG